MIRSRAAVALSLLFALSLAPSALRAADQPYTVLIDGRPLSSSSTDTGALLRDGVVFVNVVKAVKAFNGILTFQGARTAISIQHRNAQFDIGRPTAMLDGKTIKLAGAPFKANGDTYIPLTAMARIARATVRLDAAKSTAHVSTGFRAPAEPTTKPSVAPTGS